jgi:cytochrome c553
MARCWSRTISPARSTASAIPVRKRPTQNVCAALALSLACGLATAADPQAGRAKAAACAVCHGQSGISTVPNAPHLAGQPAIYLEEQLRDYRSGKRRHEVMSIIAKPLSDADIENLAAWYASIRIEASPP